MAKTVELILIPDYVNAQCCALIPGTNERCKGRWASARQVCWVWDPEKGTGVEGPYAVFCRRHANAFERYRDERIRVVGGWAGAANEHGYGFGVYDAPTGWTPAPAWWAHRSDAKFGANYRKDAV